MKKARALLLASTAIGLMLAGPAQAADTTEAIQALQAQVEALQKQLNELQAQQKAQAKAIKAAPADKKAAATDGLQKEILPGVKVTLGGFAEVDGIYRSKNQTSDLTSSFNGGIPFDGVNNAHQHEFRGTARASRLSLLAAGDPDKDTKLAAYFETDFLGAAPTANSIETNSFTPRLRQAYATVDRLDWGFHFLGGQAWSLVTMNKAGITPRKENLPMVIDGSMVVGTPYIRTAQLRFVKDFMDKKLWAGLSLESPQVSFGGITEPAGVDAYNAGGTSMSTANFSTDLAPDIVTKLAFDPGFGHYEAFGLVRFFHDQITAGFKNHTVVGGGGGIAAILPVLKDKLDIYGTAMAGKGIGRYGPVLLPDFAFKPNGAIEPLTEYMAMGGIIVHPDPTWDLYVYAGIEKSFGKDEGANGFGYGSTYAGQNNATCDTTGACTAQTSSVWQVAPGFWKKIYKGDYGAMQVGAQYSLTRRNTFADINGVAPHSYINMFFTSLRYSPF